MEASDRMTKIGTAITGQIKALFSRKRWRRLQQLTTVRRIHHPTWGFGWAFPFTRWVRFEAFAWKNHQKNDAVEIIDYGWKKCDPASYHDCTTTGRY